MLCELEFEVGFHATRSQFLRRSGGLLGRPARLPRRYPASLCPYSGCHLQAAYVAHLAAPLVRQPPNLTHPPLTLAWLCACRRIEFPLPDVFKLDLSGMTTFDDYLTSLKSRHRRAYRVRQQE